jgi:outer membrane protein TolC
MKRPFTSFSLSLVLSFTSLVSLGANAENVPLAPAPTNPTGAPRRVGLREMLQLVDKHSPDLGAARAGAQVAAEGIRRAWTAWQPDVSAGLTYDHTNAPAKLDLGGFVQLMGGVYAIRPANPQLIPPATVITGADSLYGTLQISQPILTPQGLFVIPLARDQAKAAALSANDVRDQLLLGGVRAYLSLSALDGTLDAARDAEKTALQREHEADTRLNAGVGTEIERSRAQVQTAQARAQIAAIEGQQASLRALLAQLTGEPVVPLAEGEADADLEWGSAAPVENRPWENVYAVRSLESQVHATDKLVTMDQFAWLPTLAVVGRGNYNSNTGFTGTHTSYDAIVSLSLPIYDRGVRYAALHEDEAKQSQATLALEATRTRARANWEGARANAQAAQAVLAQAESQLALAVRAQKQIEDARAAGMSTDLEMADADTQRFFAATSAAQARATLAIRRAEVAAAEGRLSSFLGEH